MTNYQARPGETTGLERAEADALEALESNLILADQAITLTQFRTQKFDLFANALQLFLHLLELQQTKLNLLTRLLQLCT